MLEAERGEAPPPSRGAREAAGSHETAGPREARDDAERELRMRAQRTSIAKDIVQMIAFSLAGVWGLSTFVYREYLVPRQTAAGISCKLSVERAPEQDGIVPLRVRMGLSNVSKGPVRALAYDLNAVAYAVRRVEGAGPAPVPSASAVQSEKGWAYRNEKLAYVGGELFEARGEAQSDEAAIVPGESDEHEIVIPVVRGENNSVIVKLGFVLLNEALADDFKPEWLITKKGSPGPVEYDVAPSCKALGRRCPLFRVTSVSVVPL
jgi:hypothetical protein